MKPEAAKAELKRITDEATGVGSSFVEATLQPREFYIYTEQLDKIREKVAISSITIDGGRIMLTAQI